MLRCVTTQKTEEFKLFNLLSWCKVGPLLTGSIHRVKCSFSPCRGDMQLGTRSSLNVWLEQMVTSARCVSAQMIYTRPFFRQIRGRMTQLQVPLAVVHFLKLLCFMLWVRRLVTGLSSRLVAGLSSRLITGLSSLLVTGQSSRLITGLSSRLATGLSSRLVAGVSSRRLFRSEIYGGHRR